MDTNRNCYHFEPFDELQRTQRRFTQSARRKFLRALDMLQRWSERAAQRRRLAELDGHMLKDIGLSRADAARESGKWFWQD